MNSVCIIGVGSPIGSDSVGWDAIDKLERIGFLAKLPVGKVILEKLDRPGVGLLQYMRGADLAIIIDALVSTKEPGSVVALRSDEIVQQEGLLSGHGLGVADAIALGYVLGDLPEHLLLLGITVEQTDDILSGFADLKPETITELLRYICLEIDHVRSRLVPVTI